MTKLRNRDVADLVQRLATAGWAGTTGVLLGLFVGILVATRLDWPMIPAILGAMVTIGGAVYLAARLTTIGAGRAAGFLHNPSGRSTPYRFDYSQATTLEAQGDYQGAASLYRDFLADDPANPDLHLRLARLLRDRLSRYDDAARAFRAARHVAPAGSRQELLITRELVELALDQRGDPSRAAPELARLIDRFPNTPEARWARTELSDIKRRVERP